MTMSDTMNDVMDAAKNGMDSAREATAHVLSSAKSGAESVQRGTENTVSSVLWAVLKGASTVAGIMTTLRKLDRDDALGWIGLSRRRSPLETIALFSSGMVVGAGIGMLLAPMTGVDLRQAILGRSKDLTQKGAHAAESVVKDGMNKAAEVKEAVVRAEHKVEAAVGAAKSSIEQAAPPTGSPTNHGDHMRTAKA
jgi:gas vesicle protein